MKKSILILLVIAIMAPLKLFCQSGIKYTYDAAGNRTKREILVLSKSGSGSSFIENTTLKESIKDDTFLPEMFKFFPNPTTGALEVEAPANPENIGIYSVTVTDINGKMIIDIKIESGRTILDLSGHQDGIYILRLNNGRRSSVWKIIKN